MTYKGYTILRGEIVKLDSGRRKGTLDVIRPDGSLATFVTYAVGNHPARVYAMAKARSWVDAHPLAE